MPFWKHVFNDVKRAVHTVTQTIEFVEEVADDLGVGFLVPAPLSRTARAGEFFTSVFGEAEPAGKSYEQVVSELGPDTGVPGSGRSWAALFEGDVDLDDSELVIAWREAVAEMNAQGIHDPVLIIKHIIDNQNSEDNPPPPPAISAAPIERGSRAKTGV